MEKESKKLTVYGFHRLKTNAAFQMDAAKIEFKVI